MRLNLLLVLILSAFAILPNVFAEDVTVEGTATEEFHLLGGSGWKVNVETVISGPSTLSGSIISVSISPIPNIQRGFLDPEITVGDKVKAHGVLKGRQGPISLLGSTEYYIKRIQSPSQDKSESIPENSELPFPDWAYSCPGQHGWWDAPEITIGHVIDDTIPPDTFSIGGMGTRYYRFYVPNPGPLMTNMLKVPEKCAIVIWLSSLDSDCASTFVSSPDPSSFEDYGSIVTLKTKVTKPAYWGVMIECRLYNNTTVLDDSDYSFVVTQECSWAGKWDTDFGEMEIQQSGDMVTGSYDPDQGRISGTVSGNKLIGTWSEPPSYSLPRHAGDFEFTMSDDCTTFSGTWRVGTTGDWIGEWTGKRKDNKILITL